MRERAYPVVTGDEKAAARVNGGHPWVYRENLVGDLPATSPGDPVDLRSPGGKYLGTGFLNLKSKIALRALTRDASSRPEREEFWARRVTYALRYRRAVMEGEDFLACRLLHAEADGFPGLVVDRYGQGLVVQCHSAGMEGRKALVLSHLVEELSRMGAPVRWVFERSEGRQRQLEGLPDEVGDMGLPGVGPSPQDGMAEIAEGGVNYLVDFRGGQKTGFFLDQKDNRRLVRTLCRGARVLDLCTHTGGFALQAAAGGAASVTALDISQAAIDLARQNAARNSLEGKITFLCADLFDYLRALLQRGGHPFDLIVLDPPAFTKSAAAARSAYRAYLEVNTAAMRLLPRGGYLATASCSHYLRESYFRAMCAEAAGAAGVSLRQVALRGSSPDHPVFWGFPESAYLKFALFQVV